MSREEFRKYLARIQAHRNRFYKETQAIPAKKGLSGLSFYQLSNWSALGWDGLYAQYLSKRRRADPRSREIEHLPHRNGGLSYANYTPLQTFLMTKERKGRLVDEYIGRDKKKLFYVASFAGMAGIVRKHHAALAQPMVWDDPRRTGQAMLRPQNAVLHRLPNVVGRVRQGLKATKVDMELRVLDGQSHVRSNPYPPGSRQYITAEPLGSTSSGQRKMDNLAVRSKARFRADDLERGKKTGIAVQYVDRNSDEFEPFAEVMKQADNRTPPRIKSKKKRIVVVSPVLDEFDEDGEMSMDLAEIRLHTFTNASHLYQSTNTRRPSSLRPPPRSSIVDYDQLPSPRRLPDTFSTRKSLTNGAEPDLDPPDSQSYPDDPQVQVEDDPDYGRISDESEEVAEVAEEGKQRAVPDEVQEPDGVEDDIARGLEGVEVPQRKGLGRRVREPQRPGGRPAKRVAIAPPERSPTPEGVRRGRRHRREVVYGRRESGLTLVPQIKEIIRVPKEPPKPLGKAGKRGRAGSVRAKTRELKTTRIIQTARMFEPRSAANSNWFFQKIFGEGDFIAAGEMRIPPRGEKPKQVFQGQCICEQMPVFYVVEGAVSVAIHESTYIISSGGMFLVPRGNTYCIHNICQRDAKLFFTQARHSVPPTSNRRRHSEVTEDGPRDLYGEVVHRPRNNFTP
ncbi:Mif2/CENP-C like-domain-containing protein [Pisolithus microcarpus]|nr:Mif2/CENP-C like-domain-containing protein [Pisolithus microcarpus]